MSLVDRVAELFALEDVAEMSSACAMMNDTVSGQLNTQPEKGESSIRLELDVQLLQTISILSMNMLLSTFLPTAPGMAS